MNIPEICNELEARTKTPIEGIIGINVLLSSGERVSFFQCDCSDEAIMARMCQDLDLYEDPEEHHRVMRRLSKLGGYRVKHKIIDGRTTINLGRRVNRIGSRIKHW